LIGQTSRGQPGPFAPAPLQDLHRYCEPVRQRARRRYSIPCGVAAWDTPSPLAARPGRIRARLLLFHTEAADQAHVVYMPDTAWPEGGTPARLVPGSVWHPGFDVVCICFDTSATIHSRSSSWSPP